MDNKIEPILTFTLPSKSSFGDDEEAYNNAVEKKQDELRFALRKLLYNFFKDGAVRERFYRVFHDQNPAVSKIQCNDLFVFYLKTTMTHYKEILANAGTIEILNPDVFTKSILSDQKNTVLLSFPSLALSSTERNAARLNDSKSEIKNNILNQCKTASRTYSNIKGGEGK